MKNILKLCLIVFIGAWFASCEDNDEEKVNVKFTVTPAIADNFDSGNFVGMEVALTDTRTASVYVATLDATGKGELKVKKGNYNVAIETKGTVDGMDVIYSSRLENLYVSQDNQPVDLSLHTLPANSNNESFIFSEIFFNGETNGYMMHPDQYFVIFNPTPQDLYMDGLSVAITYHLSWQEKLVWYDTYMPDSIPVYGFVTIPGSGQQHLLKAGERAVVAFTAIDHSAEEGYDNSVDLSGADFEIYYGPESTDVDNPAVPNIAVTEEFFFQPRGYCAPLMFKLENGTSETILAFYEENYRVHEREVVDKEGNVQIVEDRFIVVPTNKVIDAVQTSDVPQDIVTRTIPETLDRGKFLVNGCHRNELAARKKIYIGEKVYYQDTNNSSEDFELIHGQTAFPVGWRNNQ